MAQFVVRHLEEAVKVRHIRIGISCVSCKKNTAPSCREAGVTAPIGEKRITILDTNVLGALMRTCRR